MAKKRVTLETPEKVKILGISGSPRKANTYDMVKFTLKAAESMGYVETEFVSVADHYFTYCNQCMKCFGYNRPAGDPPMCYENPSSESNWLQGLMHEADATLIGFPVYNGHQPGILRMALEVHAGAWSDRKDLMSYSEIENIKPGAYISQGGMQYDKQELQYWATMWGGGAVVSGVQHFLAASWPTVEDPEPQASFRGGIVTCNDGRSVYRKDSWRASGSRINPPTTGIQQERTLRNLGRWLAVSAMMLKLGKLAYIEAGIQTPQPQSLVRFAAMPAKPGSDVDKMAKEGKMTYVSEKELKERMKIRA